MPAVPESRPVAFEQFGGEYTSSGNVQNIPPGKSPACQNVQFSAVLVSSRPGLTSRATLAGKIVSLKEFVSLDLATRRILAFTDAGTLWKETTAWTFASVSSLIVESAVAANTKMNSVTAYGREFMGFGTNGNVGVSRPLQFDDVNLDPVAPCGPGIAPTVSAPIAGSIQAGVHSIRVSFITRSGYITQPSPAVSFTFGAATAARVAAIPTGPAYVVGRIVSFTPECSADYYYLAGTTMVINDNTTTTVDIDFADSALVNGVRLSTLDDPTTDRQALIELPAQAAFGFYNGRILATGERAAFIKNRDIGLLNGSFGGGFIGNVPNGWTQLVTGGAKAAGITGQVGDAFQVTGNAGGTQAGAIQNKAFLAPFIPPGVAIGIRVRMAKSAAAIVGDMYFYVADSAAANGSTGVGAGFLVQASQLVSTEWRWFSGTLISAVNNTLATTHTLRISGGGTGFQGTAITNTGILYVDDVELYPIVGDTSASRVRVSRAQSPEEFDGLTGFLNVGVGDGQRINGAGFQIGSHYYFTKDRSLYSVRDDGSSEPADWPVTRISETVGTLSPNGVGRGDNWVAIASRNGLWYFNGAQLVKLSEDNLPTWQSINWLYAHLITVKVDTEQERILVSAPTGANTTPSTILIFEYTRSPLAGTEFNRWSTSDTAAFHSMEWSERSDATRVLLLGTDHAANGKLLQLDDSSHQDYGLAINSKYRLPYVGGSTGRNLFDKVSANVRGSGTLTIVPYGPDGLTSMQPGGGVLTAAPLTRTLAASPTQDIEWGFDSRGERLSLEFQTNAVGAWFGLQKVAILGKPEPGGSYRERTP